jgi:hypothetical protein
VDISTWQKSGHFYLALTGDFDFGFNHHFSSRQASKHVLSIHLIVLIKQRKMLIQHAQIIARVK